VSDTQQGDPAPRRFIAPEEYETLAAFRAALRHFLRVSEEAAHRLGLTPHQHDALLAIRGTPHREWVTVGELAERLQIRHHSAVGLVSRLVKEGLAVRRPAPDDRRQVRVTLTPRAHELLERLSAVHRHELRRLAPELDALLARARGDAG
jgi:DNA-binding MarR family transcriptional regulator